MMLEGLRDKEKRRIWQLGGLLLVGLLLMGSSAWLSTGQNDAVSSDLPMVAAPAAALSPEAELEQRLAAVLSRIQGPARLAFL